MSADVDITNFIHQLRDRGIPFYPAMLWVVSSAVNSREEFRMGYDDKGEAGVWDFVSPSHVHFHKEDSSFVKLVTEYSPDCAEFCRRVAGDLARHKQVRWFAQTHVPPTPLWKTG